MNTFLGIDLGSTRIKAVAIDPKGTLLAAGGYNWENRFENGVWTYYLEDVWLGLQKSVSDLIADYREKHLKPLPEVSGIGVSAMMHGYLALDKNNNQLAEFRTWRNTITGEASELLTKTFGFDIPQRWSIAHLYRAITGKEAHVRDIGFLTTLAGYVHYKLTGERVLGIGDASGMLPVDSETNNYYYYMVKRFDKLIAGYDLPWRLLDIMPNVLRAGENAGCLTKEGAKLLDPTGTLKPGIPMCPPEGDTGAWGIALLAAYMECKENDETLEDFLNNKIFKDSPITTIDPDPKDTKGFETYLERCKAALDI